MVRERVSSGGPPIQGVKPALRGLLLTANRTLVRSFRRELRRCANFSVSVTVRSAFDEAHQLGNGSYDWVAVDLDGAIAPSEAVRIARRSWPAARIAVLSCWWSERDAIARDLADVIVHKPLRPTELLELLRVAAPEPTKKSVPAAVA